MTPGRRRFRLIFPLFLFAGIAYTIGGIAKFALHQEFALAFVLCGVGFAAAAWIFGRPPRQT